MVRCAQAQHPPATAAALPEVHSRDTRLRPWHRGTRTHCFTPSSSTTAREEAAAPRSQGEQRAGSCAMGRSPCHPASTAQGHRATRDCPARGTELTGGRLALTHSCAGHSHPRAQSWGQRSRPHREVLGRSGDAGSAAASPAARFHPAQHRADPVALYKYSGASGGRTARLRGLKVSSSTAPRGHPSALTQFTLERRRGRGRDRGRQVRARCPQPCQSRHACRRTQWR